MEEIKVGDRVLMKNSWGSMYHAYVRDIIQGWFFKKYLVEWRYNDLDYGVSGNRVDFVYRWKIACKN
jgi:hypothetical protein